MTEVVYGMVTIWVYVEKINEYYYYYLLLIINIIIQNP